MTQATDLLLSLVRSVIADTAPDFAAPDSESLSALYSLAKRQEMAHLAAEGLMRAGLMPSGELGAKLRKQRLAAIFSDETKMLALDQIRTALSSAKIDFIPLKGSIMREYYPEPWMRTRCDIDVLVHREETERACDALISAGFALDRFDSVGEPVVVDGYHDVPLRSPGGVHVELHYQLVSTLDRVKANSNDEVWSYASPIAENSHEYRIADEMFYLYHIIHIAKHIRYSGCGLRPFVDLWLLNRDASELAATRTALLKQYGFDKFAEIASDAANSFMTGEACKSSVADELKALVFSGGIYGSAQMQASNWAKTPGKTLLSRIFPPSDVIAVRYPILKKHRWLYPFMAVRRLFALLFNGRAVRRVKEWHRGSKHYKENHDSLNDLLAKLDLLS